MCDREGRRMDCIDRDIAGGEEPTKAMDDLLAISLRCILPLNERPNIRQVFDDLFALEIFKSLFSDAISGEFIKPFLLDLKSDACAVENIPVQAAMATYHFVENCTSNMLEPYLDEIISKLLRCLQKGKQLLKQWALSALAAIAKSSQNSYALPKIFDDESKRGIQ
ncbi:hypothetical protein SADUNF_Sadunf07G0074800 [Salix dunnii]|uniref:Uncharacterized protein n=1 Tax=Salix dunnii TaxID=1413687 RepID=A0A835JWM8_9ROSI|nr:hypothetical protein SADUNF_Sadunf07G0074800 [Salix dunnii]